MFRKPVTWIVVGLLAMGGAFGLYWFAPWKAFTAKTVHDALSQPVAAPSVSPSVSSSTSPAVPPAGPVVLLRGSFVSHEHETSGTARIVRAADGSRRLELVGLATSDGPDLWVWLTDGAGLTDGAAKPGRYLQLDRLKGNRGDQVYPIPADADLSGYRSVAIWCVRFSVSFGAAELAP